VSRQFVVVKFNPWDRRTYTYHWDGEPLQVGDECKVQTNNGLGKVTVERLTDRAPDFATKPIKEGPRPPEQGALL
jgi:hypothetical protein